MSYGLKIENDNGSLVISDERVVPRFVGKATYSGAYSNGGVILTYSLSGMTPGDLFIPAYTLPNNGASVWYGQDGDHTAVANGSGVVTFNIQTKNFVIGNTLPELYVFTLSRPTAEGTYGLSMRDGAGALTYTTAQSPLMIQYMPSLALGGSVAVSGLPSKPAFFPAGFFRVTITSTPTPSPGSHNTVTSFGGYRLESGTVYASQVELVNVGGIGATTPADFQYGSSASQPLPIIDAASYD